MGWSSTRRKISAPLERCLEDVRSSEVYVVIAAWRYGFIPADAVNRKAKRSITELEYQEAVDHKLAVLAFLLDPGASWASHETTASRRKEKCVLGPA